MSSKLTGLVATALCLGLLAPAGPAEAFMGAPDTRCSHNYFDQKPCVSSVRPWRQFADRQGLAYDRESAAIYEAYAEHRYELGDRLLAQAKGVDPAEVAGTGRQLAANPDFTR